MKTCSKCGSSGPFYNVRGRVCVECRRAAGKKNYGRNRDRILARQRERYASDPAFKARLDARTKAHYQKNKERVKGQIREARMKEYGLTLERFDQLFENQEGMCAICSVLMTKRLQPDAPARRACVDHDHSSGKVRGLLCASCNSGIGQLRDSTALLRNAIGYLEDAAVAA